MATAYNQVEPTEEDIEKEIAQLSFLADEFNDETNDDWINDLNLDDTANRSRSFANISISTSGIDPNTLNNWIFPVQAYEKRDYQLNISKNTIHHNTLVILPTGLGKTFIASVAIFNFMRFFPNSKIVFMAPTRPLVNQQMSACYDVVGIPKEETAELTGKIQKEKRKNLWRDKRLFFCTPQVLKSDLAENTFPAQHIKMLVFDEAHKAKGNYAYCEVIRAMKDSHSNFRVLALTATAGKSSDIIEIIQNLLISKIEYRSEDSIDVRKYTHRKSIEITEVKFDREMRTLINKFEVFINPFLERLKVLRAINSFCVSRGSLIMQQKRARENTCYSSSERNEIMELFSNALPLVSSLEMLERHGIHLFLKSLRDDTRGGSFKYFVMRHLPLKQFVEEIEEKYGKNIDELATSNQNCDYGHPKFDILRDKLQEYFANNGSKAIVFCEFRETAAMIHSVLERTKQQIQSKMLIGQGGKMTQKEQLAIMKSFREGKINTLVCTSVGEEGLDIGEVDLVICFDISSNNATRFVQRIGRTGRKRNGRVIVLASEGKELHTIRGLIHTKDSINRSISKNKSIANYFYKGPSLFPQNFAPKCLEMKFNVLKEVEIDEGEATTSKKKKTAKVNTIKLKGVRSIRDFAVVVKKNMNTNDVSQPKIDEDILDDIEMVDINQEIIIPVNEPVMEIDENSLDTDTITASLKTDFEMRINALKASQMMIKILKIQHLKSLKSISSFAEFMKQPLEEKDLPEINFDNIDMAEIEGECSQEPVINRYNNPFDNSVAKSKSIFNPVNTDFIFNNNSQSPIHSQSPRRDVLRTPSRRLVMDPEQSPFEFHPKHNDLIASTPVANYVKKKSPQKKKVDTPFEFLGIASIDDIFEGCTTYNFTEKTTSRAEAMINSQVQNHIDGVLESDIEEIGPSNTPSPAAKSVEISQPKVLSQLNLNMLDDLFGCSEEEEQNANTQPTPNSLQNHEINEENFNLSDKTVEYDVEEELTNRRNENSPKTPEMKENSFMFQIQDTIPIKKNESVVNNFISPVSTRKRPNISRLLTAIKSETILTQTRSPLNETTNLMRSFSSPGGSQFKDNPSQIVASDSDSPASPVAPQRAVIRKRRPKNKHRGFLATQAAVDDDIASSDEEDDDFDNSIVKDFIANETMISPNQTNMYAKYVQSVRSPVVANFRMPRASPKVRYSQVFSQIVHSQQFDDYDEDDSFVVANEEDVEESESEDELEIAERKLKEMKKKRKGRQIDGNTIKKRKVIRIMSDSDEDDEMKKLRAECI